MFKKIAAFALVAALGVMTLTGCGGDAAKEGTETQTETTESTDGGSTDANADAEAAEEGR